MSETTPPLQSSGAAPSRALPQIVLCNDGPVTLAKPAENTSLTFETFALPPVPQSVTDWCALVGQRFWADRSRCLGIMLLLNVKLLQWSTAIPAQRCSPTASCWSAALADFPDFPPGNVLAGSFQTRVLNSGEEPIDCPPPSQGLHFVQRLGPDVKPQPIWSFVRAGDQTIAVDGCDVIFDDWSAALDQAMPRLTIL